MAILRVCDLCKGHPMDYDAKSGGDVRQVAIHIAAEESGQVGAPPEDYNLDMCAPCRERVLGEIARNFVSGPQTATAVNPHPAMRDVPVGVNRFIRN